MIRFIIFSVVVAAASLPMANAQQTSATPLVPAVAPAVTVTDASGNLLIVERRAASSIPGAAATAIGLATRIVIVPPQIGATPSTTVYSGTMGAFYAGKRAIYTILTVAQRGRPTRSLVAIDGGANGTLPQSLPAVTITLSGGSDIRVVSTPGNKDAIYIVQQPPTVRRTTGATTTIVPNAGRTITIVEFDGVQFSPPHSVTVQ